ncbi:MAG: hypothetical protein AB7H80_11530 [Candidatus Kapaibacterium sp.]
MFANWVESRTWQALLLPFLLLNLALIILNVSLGEGSIPRLQAKALVSASGGISCIDGTLPEALSQLYEMSLLKTE